MRNYSQRTPNDARPNHTTPEPDAESVPFRPEAEEETDEPLRLLAARRREGPPG